MSGLFPDLATAQTAHFSDAQSTAVGSGLNTPYGVAVDASGNLYVADTFNNAVHKYAPNGSGGYTQLGDVGSGLTRPAGVAADAAGNVYIADNDNNRVLKETLSGGTYTQSIVESGLSAPHGVAVDASGNVYIADSSNDRVLKETLSGGTYTQSTLASGLSNPNGVAVDASGNVYIADTDNNRVLKETFSGGSYTQSTVVIGLSGPWGIAVDGSENFYVSNSLNALVLKYAANGSSYTQVDVLGSGLVIPTGTAVDSNGVVYVVDTSNNRVLKLQTAGVNFNELAVGSTSAIQSLTFTFDSGGTIGAPVALTMGAANLDFTDAGSGTCTTNGSSHTYSATNTCTVDVVFTPKFSGIRRGGIELITGSGAVIATAPVYGTGTGPQAVFLPSAQSTPGGGFLAPIGIAADSSGNMYVADTLNNTVKKIPAGCTTSACVTTLGGGFSLPTGIALDGSGNVYVTDSSNHAVKKMPATCTSSACVTTVGGGFSNPLGIALDGSGNAYVAESGDATVKRVPAGCLSSSCVTTLGGGITQAYGVALDTSGAIYTTDSSDTVIKKMPATCTSSACVTRLGGGFNHPFGVAIDASGTIYVADHDNNALKQMPAGCTSSACVTTMGSFSQAAGLALDDSGNLYLSQSSNQINKLDRTTAPSLSFASTNVGSTSSDSPKTVTAQNIGNTALNFPVPGTGNNPSISTDFLLDGSSTCPQLSSSSGSAGTLLPGESCTFNISFKPQSVDNISGSLVITDDHLNASPSTSHSIALSAIGSPSVSSFTIMGLGTANAGTVQTITVTAKDSGGGTYTGYTGTIHFTSSDTQAVLPAAYTFTVGDGGVHSFPITLKTAGTQSLTVADAVVTSATGMASGVISPGAAVSYFLDAPGAVSFYTAFSFRAYAHDAYGNTDTSYNGTAVVSSSDPGFSNLGPFTFSNGATTVYTAFKTAGNQTLTLTDSTNSSITGTATIYMAPGPVVGLTVSAPASATVGQAISVTVRARDLFNNTVMGYTGPVSFSSTDARAALPPTYTFVGADNGTHTFTATLRTPGNQSITATDTVNSVGGTSGIIAASVPLLVVTTSADDAGAAANCTQQATRGTGTDASCSLRDALMEAAVLGAADITFDSTRFATAKTIALTNGTLTIPSNTSVTGATSGSGATLTNLVTVQGGGASSNFSVFQVDSGTDAAAMRNLIIRDGYVNSQGGGIINSGTLTITDCTFTNNFAGGYATGGGNGGGAIYVNSGNLTIVGSTFSGNISSPGGAISIGSGTATIINSTFFGNVATALKAGGAIFNNSGATVTIASSTFSGNSATGGGAIFNYGTLTVSNSVLAGNTSDDCGNGGSNTCPTNGSDGNVVGPGTLTSLDNYGGPTQTMIPLPDSPAICAGLIANIPGGITHDQRGYGRTTSYSGPPCVDSGAVQTAFALAFTKSPSDVAENVSMNPAPEVTLTEHGPAFTPAVTVPLTLVGTGTLSGGSATTSSGVASYSALKIDTASTGDKLQANLALNSNASITVSATSSAFNVTAAVSQLLFGTPPATPIALGGNAGEAVTVREAAPDNSTVTTAADTITLTVSGPSSYSQIYTATAVNGVATFNLSSAALTRTGTYTYTATLGPLQAAATQTVNKGTATVLLGGLSATYDGNLHAATATTTPSGLTVDLTYNGASAAPTAAGSYSIVATVNDANYEGSATGTLTIGKATPSITWATPAPITYGTPLSTAQLNATSAIAGSYIYTPPAGIVLASGLNQQLAVAFTPSDTANYENATASTVITVKKQATAIGLVTSATTLPSGQTFTITATVTPASNGTPSGTVTFQDGNTVLQTVALSGSTASYSPTLTAGSHILTATYSGDANYLASSTSEVNIIVAPSDFTIASTGANSQTVVPGGTAKFTYALTPTAGSYPGPVTFTVSGLPSGATYSLSPESVAANAGPQQVTLAIQTPPSTADISTPNSGWTLSILLLPFASAGKLRSCSKKLARTLYILIAICFCIGITGCGSGNGFLVQSPHDYAVTITASSGPISHSSTVTLNVQ